MNMLDLGLFNGIQFLTSCRAPKIPKELVEGVHKEFDGYDITNPNKVFKILQTCMVKSLNNGGYNGYKCPN
jgi:hypothetical protein